ncbi:MAG: transcription-repair coupling factor [Deltaproteobacteria bacterium]|nr:transcription-repair coupling factor [Deltaproteobacteria bacterium]
MITYRFVNIPKLASGVPTEVAAKSAAQVPRFDLTGAQGGSLAPFLVQLSDYRKAPVVVFVEDMTRARALVQDLTYHLQVIVKKSIAGQILLFPSYDLSPYDEAVPMRSTALQRTAVLFQLAYGATWRFLVVPADAALLRLMPLNAFESACLPVSVGEEVDRNELIECMERGGYHRAPLVEEPGTYAVRGSLVDIFPPYASMPARVDMFGSLVEKIRLFDPVTQASADEADEIWIHPTRLAVQPSSSEDRRLASERLRAICDSVNQPTGKTGQLINDVLDGSLLVGFHGFQPAFHSSLGAIHDYLPASASVCVENPAGVRLAWRKLESSLAADYDRRRAEGLPSFPKESHLLSRGEIESFISKRPFALIHSLAVSGAHDDLFAPTSDVVDLQAVSTADLGERLRHMESPGESNVDLVGALSRHVEQLDDEGYETTIVAHTQGQASRLASMLQSRDLEVSVIEEGKPTQSKGINITVGELARGYILPADARCVLAEEEIFGQRSRRRRSSVRHRRAGLDDLRLLKPSDLVVHVEHGVGRYEGLVRKRVRSAEMDFLLITYRGGDRLYLPVYRLNQVQKYRGGDGQNRLDKLGGQTFARALNAVKRATREMAGELLDLYARRTAATRTPFSKADDLYHAFEAGFPFDETEDQERAIDEVIADLESDRPMDRLVCGDVGFGKTEVAMRAAFRVVMEGRQIAVLVPTTVLAQQHFQTFKERFKSYPVRVERLSRFQTQAQNRDVVLGLKDGTVDIVIGTHRLLSKDVHFKRLGLLVVDEEHRFGVAHKERIRRLRASVDTLVLTATPIPRTLQMAFGQIRDLSIIGSAPAARRPVRTMICHDDPEVLRGALARELSREGQVFYVHNRVRDIAKVAERVKRMVPDARVAIGHGQMKEDKLERVMLDFVAGQYDILVCTSIIESGLDIPRANTIIIDRADTFGLAQLYQIRGRVGRSSLQAYAYLVVPPLSVLTEEARQRVETLARYTDLGSGFSVATMDMEIRGAGNLLGPQQSGTVSAVGFEMFCDLLAEAAAEIRGEKQTREIEPELTFERPGFIPDEYIPDVGQRLQYYKHLASAESEEAVEEIAADLVDRYGPLHEDTEDLVQVMIAKSMCRNLKIRGIESTTRRLTVHLAPDTRVSPDRVIDIVHKERGFVRLTDDLKIVVRLDDKSPTGAQAAIRFLHRLGACDNNPPIS